MGKVLDNLKKGYLEFEIPDSWSKRKAKWVIIGLLLFSVAFGMLHAAENNPFLLSFCIFSAFASGQLYFIYCNWDVLKKKKETGICIFLEEIEGGYFCSKGFATTYGLVSKYEPSCKTCERKTVVK